MNINYSYVVNEVNTDNNTMMVTYTSEGYEDVTVGTRLPFKGEAIEECIKKHAPFNYWELTGSEYDQVTSGVSGSIVSEDSISQEQETFESVKQSKLDEIANWRFNLLDREVVSGGVSFRSGHATLGTLRAIKESMVSGIYSTVNFKAIDGQFHVLDQASVESAITAVSLDIQDAFNQEYTKVSEVNALSTIDEIKSYTV